MPHGYVASLIMLLTVKKEAAVGHLAEMRDNFQLNIVTAVRSNANDQRRNAHSIRVS